MGRVNCRMGLAKSLFGFAVVCGLGGIAWASEAAAAPPATQPTVTDQKLLDRINALESEVQQLKSAQQQATQQEAQRQAANDASTLQQIQVDAARQSQFLDSMGVSAGYANRRFFIQSDDGNFVLRPWIHVQIRDTTNWREDFFTDPNGDNTQNGFEVRRARLGFDGNLFTPDFTYFINWATNRENGTLTVKNAAGATVGTTTSPVGGEPVLEEAWVKYNLHDTPWYVHVGQMHDPLDHENMVGSEVSCAGGISSGRYLWQHRYLHPSRDLDL